MSKYKCGVDLFLGYLGRLLYMVFGSDADRRVGRPKIAIVPVYFRAEGVSNIIIFETPAALKYYQYVGYAQLKHFPERRRSFSTRSIRHFDIVINTVLLFMVVYCT
jgi:hypothetical protein